jgi:hypothetical protein
MYLKPSRHRVLGWFVGLAVLVQELLWLLVGPIENIFSVNLHYFNAFVSITQQPWQVTVLGRLSLSVCLWWLS